VDCRGRSERSFATLALGTSAGVTGKYRDALHTSGIRQEVETRQRTQETDRAGTLPGPLSSGGTSNIVCNSYLDYLDISETSAV
jgi:hypothetical protein